MEVATLLIAAIGVAVGIVALTKKVHRGLLTDQLLKDLLLHLHCIQGSPEVSRGRGCDVYTFMVRVDVVDTLVKRVEQEIVRIEIQ